MYQSLAFNSIDIRLDPAVDKKFNAIVNSTFNPGQYLREIYVQDFTAPTEKNFNALDKKADLIYLLMKHCPSVKAFDFL